MIGETYGKLVVISEKFRKVSGRKGVLRYAVRVRCECGDEREVFVHQLINKNGTRECKQCVRKRTTFIQDIRIDHKQKYQSKRTVAYISYNGETLSLWEWAKKLNISIRLIQSRYYHGWSHEDIIETPIGQRRASQKK